MCLGNTAYPLCLFDSSSSTIYLADVKELGRKEEEEDEEEEEEEKEEEERRGRKPRLPPFFLTPLLEERVPSSVSRRPKLFLCEIPKVGTEICRKKIWEGEEKELPKNKRKLFGGYDSNNKKSDFLTLK